MSSLPPRAMARAREIPFSSIAGVRDVTNKIAAIWKTAVPQTLTARLKHFLLKVFAASHDSSSSTASPQLEMLVHFYSNDQMIEHTHGQSARHLRDASYSIAKLYMKIGMVAHAKSMLLNGCFIDQCLITHISKIARILKSTPPDSSEIKSILPTFYAGFNATKTQQGIDRFLSVDNFDKGEPSNAVKIRISSEAGEEHRIDVSSSTPMKTIFKEYSERCGVSLRSLRFSYQGKTLFLSTIGNKSPIDLNMDSSFVIHACNTDAFKEASTNTDTGSAQSRKKARAKGTQVKIRSVETKKSLHIKEERRASEEDTIMNLKIAHSGLLTKLHEEAEPTLKAIRRRLNELNLEQKPRKKKNRAHSVAALEQDVTRFPESDSGRAGTPFYMINVGDTQNLYTSTKQKVPLVTSCTVDLHGCTQSEALDTLEERLHEWIDTAMRGAYPWVISVKIVVGCGNQILSDAVRKWIKDTAGVCNAPKNHIFM